MTVSSAVLARLVEVVGEGGLSVEAADRAAVAQDLWPRLLIESRGGLLPTLPDVVVWPGDATQVAGVLRVCADTGTPFTPFGAGTGVCGAAVPLRGGVVVDLKRMRRILAFDDASGHVTVEPGILGIDLETACNERGWTVAHVPSSLTVSTVGGMVATRSCGQLSTRYGRIDDLVAGLDVVLPDGSTLSLRPQPATGSGPDLRRLFCGSEGQLGIVVAVTLRLHRRPAHRADLALCFPDFPSGVDACRDLLQDGLRPALLRLYDSDDTALQVHHLGLDETSGCLCLVACEGRREVAEAEAAAVAETSLAHGARQLSAMAVERWYRRRFDLGFEQARYLSVAGAVLDTIEVAAPWSRIVPLWRAVKERVGQRVVVLCHLSHGYCDGACLYFTLAGHEGDEAAARSLHRWLWEEAMSATLEAGGTIAHHHGAGLARAPFLAAELGPTGVEVLRRVKGALDPGGIANPGKWGDG